MNNAVSQSRGKARTVRAGGNVLSAFLIAILMLAGGYYLLRTMTTGDPLWFRTDFDAQPRLIIIHDRGELIEIGPTDPRFAPIADAFNRSIERGYDFASMGFSDPTWDRAEQVGLMVETNYSEPVRLHGNFVPTRRMRILIDGENIHRTGVLFRSNENDWQRSPWQLHDISLLEQTIRQYGFGE